MMHHAGSRQHVFHAAAQVVSLATLGLLMIIALSAPAGAGGLEGNLVVKTVPPLPNIEFELDGSRIETDAQGMLFVPMSAAGSHQLSLVSTQIQDDGLAFSFNRWSDGERALTRPIDVGTLTSIEVGFVATRDVRLTYIDADGRSLESSRITSLKVEDDEGKEIRIADPEVADLSATRVVRREDELREQPISYRVSALRFGGEDALGDVAAFTPASSGQWTIGVDAFTRSLVVEDLLLSTPLDVEVSVKHPDGSVEIQQPSNGTIELDQVPAGRYSVAVDAPGFSLSPSFDPSSEGTVRVRHFTALDGGVVLTVLLVNAVVILLGLRPLRGRTGRRWARVRPVRDLAPTTPDRPLPVRPGDLAIKTFSIAEGQGYDSSEVDGFLRRLAADWRLAVSHRSGASTQSETQAIGRQVDEVLENATNSAKEIMAEANHKADRVWNEALRRAETIEAAAHHSKERSKRAAHERSERIIDEAQNLAQTIKTDANRRAKALLDDVEEQFRRLAAYEDEIEERVQEVRGLVRLIEAAAPREKQGQGV